MRVVALRSLELRCVGSGSGLEPWELSEMLQHQIFEDYCLYLSQKISDFLVTTIFSLSKKMFKISNRKFPIVQRKLYSTSFC